MVDIKTNSQSIQSLVNAINKNKYNFDLPIQRRAGIWNRKEISLFIDSIVRSYPIYPALVNKHSDTKVLDVVDFKQRFTSLADYVNDKFALSKTLKPVTIDGVEYELAGKKFSKLDEVVRDTILNRDLSITTMTDATPEEINDIFDRINMGHPLGNGHKRSTIESDELREIVYSLASHPFFDKVVSVAQRKKNEDRDMVIQVLMLTELSNDYDFGSFRNQDINKFIEYYNDNISETKIENIKKALDKLDEHFTEKVKIKKTSLPFVIFGVYKALKDNKSVTKYLEWVDEFLESYNTNEDYLVFCNGSGTAASDKVKGRLAYFRSAVNKL